MGFSRSGWSKPFGGACSRRAIRNGRQTMTDSLRLWPMLTLMAACAQQSPPPPPSPVETPIAAPADSVWRRAVDYLASQRLTVTTSDRASGLLTVRAAPISWAQWRAWANCGGSGGRTIQSMNDAEMRAKNIQATADVSLTVRANRSATTVRPVVGIGATWSNPMLRQQAARFECVSNGTLEAALLAALRAP